MRILVTGFEPFGTDQENASAVAVARLAVLAPEALADDIELSTTILPVSFARSGPALAAAVTSVRPDAVLAVGEAGGRDVITPELWGVNSDNARIPDNDGARPHNTRIDDGPERRASGLDADSLVTAIRAAGLPARTSDDAGRFVCNHIAYLVAKHRTIPGGFVHVPAVRSTGRPTVGTETDPGNVLPTPALNADDLARALAACVTDIARQLRGGPSSTDQAVAPPSSTRSVPT